MCVYPFDHNAVCARQPSLFENGLDVFVTCTSSRPVLGLWSCPQPAFTLFGSKRLTFCRLERLKLFFWSPVSASIDGPADHPH